MGPFVHPAGVALAALVATLVLLRLLLATGLAWRLAVDHPNERSLHARPVPRCGGFGIVPVVVIATLLAVPGSWLLGGAVLGLALLSWLDDRYGLPIALRFACQTLAVMLLLWVARGGLPLWMVAVALLVWLWMINLYNFMDGADGLAGSMAAIGFAALAIPLWPVMPGIALAAAATSGAALGFLFFNWPPAQIFMGDVGSIPLGFLAGAFAFLGWRAGAYALWYPLLVFSPFIADASVTLVRRALKGEAVWRAHREHFYQRLVQSGFGHERVAPVWAGLMVAAAALAYGLRHAPAMLQAAGILVWMAWLALLFVWIDGRYRRARPAAAPDAAP